MGDAPLDSFSVSPGDIAEAAARLRHRTLLRTSPRGGATRGRSSNETGVVP